MNNLVRRVNLFLVVTALSFSIAVMGCGGDASEDELRQLNDLKAEIASLEQQVSAKETEKADLDKQVAEKNQKLQECNADKAAAGTAK